MDEIPHRIAVNCQRPVTLFGKNYRWIIETPDGPLRLRGPLGTPFPPSLRDFVMRGPHA